MVGTTDGADIHAANADLPSLSPRLAAALRGSGCAVVPAGDAVLQVAWRARPQWAHVGGWLLLPLAGAGALLWRIRRTETCTLTLQADRAGVRIHLTGRLPEPARLAALGVVGEPSSAARESFSGMSLGKGPAAPAGGLVTAVPGRSVAPTVVPVPSPAPESASVVRAAPPLPPSAQARPQQQPEHEQHTVSAQSVRNLAASGVTFALDNGLSVAVAGFGLLGREPAPAAGEEGAQLVALADATRSVSKTHLAFGTNGGAWVMDRGSTNGSVVITADGSRTACVPGVRTPVSVGDTVQFGDRSLVVHGAVAHGESSPSTFGRSV